jgi:hypothetical protein
MTYAFDEGTMKEYKRKKGQVFLGVPIVCEGSTSSDEIEFMYDTGAYITVLNRYWYEWYRLDRLPRFETVLSGYAGSARGYIFRIPGLIIGRRLLTGVWAFTPESMDVEHNLLGDNVIEYFMPFQDNQRDCFYFPDNPSPEPYVHPGSGFSLACESVMPVKDFH